MDLLVTALLDLTHPSPNPPKPVLVGGVGLYLMQRHLEERPDVEMLNSCEL